MMFIVIIYLFFGFNINASSLDVYTLKGQDEGPVLMVIAGIHGDEPAGPKAIELYKDIKLKKGKLVLVPHANKKALLKNKRYINVDMNRIFNNKKDDINYYEYEVVKELKELMKQADMVVSLHEAKGFYGKNKEYYGQSVVIDDVKLKKTADNVVNKLNAEQKDKDHYFYLNFQDTKSDTTKHPEQRGSATYYSVYELGVPAYGVETSKGIKNLSERVAMQCLGIRFFMEELGVKMARTGNKIQPECNIN
jgi:predicted deacylase